MGIATRNRELSDILYSMKKEFDFIAVGDITTDAFIRLEQAEAHCDLKKKECQLCVEFGAKIPYEFVKVVPAVGNCANAAVAAARLGLHAALLTNQGDDDIGKEHLRVLKREKVSTEFVKSHWKHKTNYHYVLWYHDERTILVKHEDYEYSVPDIGSPKWLYVTSLGSNTLKFHDELKTYLGKHKKTKLAFQPGTFQINLGHDKLSYFYERSAVFVCNVEEAEKILGLKGAGIEILLKKMQKLGPDTVLITDGPKGAYVRHGTQSLFMPPYPDPKAPYERTGAGDAFASTFVSALALGLTPEEAITWAPINSMSVVQKIGAQEGLLSREDLEHFLDKAPKTYRPVELK